MAFLSPIFVAFGLVLVAACANASNVMLARANARHREIGIRLSIGASRGRIVRQLLTEGVLIALLAGVTGLALATTLRRIGTFTMIAMLPANVAARVRLVPLDFDLRVLAFTFVLACAATILFALLPALQATRVTLTDALRGQLNDAVRSGTLRNLLITGQVTVSLVLLIVALTLVRNGAAISGVDLGMNISGVVSVRDNRSDKTTFKRAHEALTGDPRAGQAAVASRAPLFGDAPRAPIKRAEGFVFPSYGFVSPGYFELLGIPLLRGRGFSEQEAALEAPVAVVGAHAAALLWPGEDPLGKTFRITIPPPGGRQIADTVHDLRRPADVDAAATEVTVVGVVGDAINGFIYHGVEAGHLYMPTALGGSRASVLLVRGRGTFQLDGMRSILQRISPDPLRFDVLPVDDMVQLQRFPLRAASYIGTLLSTIALALSISGLYGVLAYTFGQRTKEIGIRMALGASTQAVKRLVLVQSARLASAGTVVGLLIGFAIMKLLSRFVRLSNVSVLDPIAFGISLLLIAAAAALASYGPARRAAGVDPSSMLRADG
jgi:predicted permease